MGAMAAQHMHWSTSMEISVISDFVYMEFTTYFISSSFIYLSVEISNKLHPAIFDIPRLNFLIIKFQFIDDFLVSFSSELLVI